MKDGVDYLVGVAIWIFAAVGLITAATLVTFGGMILLAKILF